MASNPDPGSSNAIAGALTYPASNSQMEPVADQPRQPRTLQGLLRFAMEATKAEDAPGSSQLGPMDEERRRFLSEALNAQTVNISNVLRKNIKILTDMEKMGSIKQDDPLPEEILAAFEELGEFIDDIDVANDFEKLGGFIIFPMCYSCDCIELHRWANLTLAQVCQNNPHCQERALRCCLLPVLLHRLRDHEHDDGSLRALSSMIRNYEPGVRSFMAQCGCEVLADCLRYPQRTQLGSAAFLATYLCRTFKVARDLLMKNNIIQIIVDILKSNQSDVAAEYLLNVLVALIEKQPADVLPIYQDPSLDLRRTLENHMTHARFIEEKEACVKIFRLAFMEELDGWMEKVDLGEVEPADR